LAAHVLGIPHPASELERSRKVGALRQKQPGSEITLVWVETDFYRRLQPVPREAQGKSTISNPTPGHAHQQYTYLYIL